MVTQKKKPADSAETVPGPPETPTRQDSQKLVSTADTLTPNVAEASTAKPAADPPQPPAESEPATPQPSTSSSAHTQRITAIEVENFKGIGRAARIELRPVTLLFGRNSAGKSTILHAFCYANEILNHKNIDAQTTSAGGDNVRLGGFDNLVHSHDPTRSVRFRFDLDLHGWTVPLSLLREFADRHYDPQLFDHMDGTEWFRQPVTSAWIDVTIAASRGKPAVTSYGVAVNDLYLGGINLQDGGNVVAEANAAHPILLDYENFDPETLEPEPSCTIVQTHLVGSALPPWDELLTFADDDLQAFQGLHADCDWPLNEFEYTDHFSAIMSFLLVGIGATLADELSHFRYIGPVRDLHPEMTVGSRTRGKRSWADGSAAWDVLCDRTTLGPSTFIDDVNAWLEQDDRLDTGYRLEDHSYVELPANAPLVHASRLLPGLGVSFFADAPFDDDDDFEKLLELNDDLGDPGAKRLTIDLLDDWLRGRFSPFVHQIHEPELLDAVIDKIKSDEAIDAALGPLRDRIHSSVLEGLTSRAESDDPELQDTLRETAHWATLGILHTAVFAQLQYRKLLAVRDLLNGKMRSEIPQLLACVAAAPLHTRLRLITTSGGLSLSTSDIGVGISQLLPVVVAALDVNRPSLTAVEQPELHIHPRLQVELGDLFAHSATPGKLFLLETHSEHLILRLLRRIEETNSGTLPPDKPRFNPADLSVMYIDQVDGETHVSPLRVDDSGEFVDGWPHGFFNERARELF